MSVPVVPITADLEDMASLVRSIMEKLNNSKESVLEIKTELADLRSQVEKANWVIMTSEFKEDVLSNLTTLLRDLTTYLSNIDKIIGYEVRALEFLTKLLKEGNNETFRDKIPAFLQTEKKCIEIDLKIIQIGSTLMRNTRNYMDVIKKVCPQS